jgi:hypothetical protein
MNATLAFAGTYLVSLFVALLATLQLGDYFGANAEFGLILMATAAFATVAIAAFMPAAHARHPAALYAVATVLALSAFVPLALPGLVAAIASHSTNPYTVGIEQTYIAVELIVPALVTVVVQCALLRRYWLRRHGEEMLTRWPWVATVLAGLVIFNPLGLDLVGQAISYHASNWMRDFARVIVLGCTGVLIAIGLVEYYIRGWMLRRRSSPNAPAYG